MRRISVGFVLLILISGCASTGNVASSTDGETYVRGANQRFMTAFNAGNVDTLAALYADDAVVLGPNAPIAKGNAAIREFMRSMITTAHPVLDFGPDRVVQSGDLTYEYGHYTMQIGPNKDQGSYVTVWRRMPNGSWKIVADSVNSSLPPPQPMR